MSKTILSWFEDRKNVTVLDMAYEHLSVTTKAVHKLYEMVQVVGKSPENKNDYFEVISRYELEADRIRRSMVKMLSTRDIYVVERDDLMELVRAVDWVADWAHEASRLLVVIPFEVLPEEFRKSIEKMCGENYKCVKVLGECIHELSKNPKKALELADQVEIFEEDLDGLYSIARVQFVELDVGISRGAMILLNEFLVAIETVADWCENTADVARAIALRVI